LAIMAETDQRFRELVGEIFTCDATRFGQARAALQECIDEIGTELTRRWADDRYPRDLLLEEGAVVD
jgi:hypothetical protein